MQRLGGIQPEQHGGGDQHPDRAQRRPDRRGGQGGQEQRHRRDPEHRDDHVRQGEHRPPASSCWVSVDPLRLTVPAAGALAEQQPALDVGHRADHQHGQHHEGDHGDQLGQQQVGPPDRPDQQIAQGAGLGLAGDRVAAQHRDRDRQEQRQHHTRARPAGTASRR